MSTAKPPTTEPFTVADAVQLPPPRLSGDPSPNRSSLCHRAQPGACPRHGDTTPGEPPPPWRARSPSRGRATAAAQWPCLRVRVRTGAPHKLRMMTDLIDETLSREEWETREIYTQFGVAIYFCQVLEFNLVTYAQLVRRARLGRPMTDDELAELRERLLEATFGQNYGEVNDLLQDKWVLGEEMKAAVNLRNDLVHHWMRDRVEGFNTSESRREMIGELRQAAATLQTTVDFLSNRTAGFLGTVGVSRQQIESEFGHILGRPGERH
jgi:hypothetical protein